MDLAAISKRYHGELEMELRSVLGDSPLPLYDMMRYHLGWTDEYGRSREVGGGKGLRPTLCLLASEAVGGDWRLALPAAAALELVHNFSLVHDDIEDESGERRRRPTVWRIWGRSQAINVGDGMYALGRLGILHLEDRGVNTQKMLQAARLLDEACLRLCEGQYLDVHYETCLDISVADYLEMIGLKTAALFRCSLELGALLGTEDNRLIDHLGRFGEKLGLLYQIRDDILGIWGREEATGKSSLDDIKRRKKTLPVVYGLEKVRGQQKEELLRVYRGEVIGPDEVGRVLHILDGLDARGYAQGVAEDFCREALALLASVPVSSPALNELRMVAASLLEREY